MLGGTKMGMEENDLRECERMLIDVIEAQRNAITRLVDVLTMTRQRPHFSDDVELVLCVATHDAIDAADEAHALEADLTGDLPTAKRH